MRKATGPERRNRTRNTPPWPYLPDCGTPERFKTPVRSSPDALKRLWPAGATPDRPERRTTSVRRAVARTGPHLHHVRLVTGGVVVVQHEQAVRAVGHQRLRVAVDHQRGGGAGLVGQRGVAAT